MLNDHACMQPMMGYSERFCNLASITVLTSKSSEALQHACFQSEIAKQFPPF